MSEKITRVVHRHDDQDDRDPDLVLEVGTEIPRFYQNLSSRRGAQVLAITKIAGGLRCDLNTRDGDMIFVGVNNIREIG
ncbi:hypothetical protein [Aestuariivirga sp.]|uniref:hypothetical protein n=1 Tax=Aestuariivirga sp. TaxID=2650926 RepID=UPI00301593D6